MTTKVSGCIFGQPFKQTLENQPHYSYLGAGALHKPIRVVLEDKKEELGWKLIGPGKALIPGETPEKDIPILGKSGTISGGSIKFINPEHKRNFIEATHSNKERR